MSQSPSARQDRIRVTQACESCRDKKSRCDGGKPVCGRCQAKGLDCHYGLTKRIKNQQAMKELATKVAQYEALLKKNIPAQQRLLGQSTSTPVAPDALSSPTLREAPSTASSTTPDHPSSSRNLANDSSSVSRRPSEIISPMNESSIYHTYISETPNIDGVQIPPRSILEQAVSSFFEGTALIFPFFDEEEVAIFFDQIYGQPNKPPSKVAAVQLCAAAAVGCQYFPLRFDATTRLTCLSIVKLSIEECIEEAPLPAMRILALLAMYFTFEKKTAALMYIDMGLRLAKMNHTKTMIFTTPRTPWQRVYGSLIFLDGWLCSTTGHLPSLQNRELYSSMAMLGTKDASVAVIVQFEMIKIAMLSTSILQDVYHARYVSSVTIISYKNQLQQWLVALPDFMRLDFLLRDDKKVEYLRPIFLVHLMYMCTLILLYRRSLVDISDLGNKWPDTETFGQTQEFLEPCLWTGRQIAKLLDIALSQGQVFQKCWMYIYATYSTCNVLLYFITSRLAHGSTIEEVNGDIVAVQKCIDVLTFCAGADEVAGRYLRNASEIYDQIQKACSSLSFQNYGEDSERLDNTKTLLRRLTSLSATLLIHPFDGGYRREVKHILNTTLRSIDPTRSSPWSDMDRSDMEMLSLDNSQVHGKIDNVFLKDFVYIDSNTKKKEDAGKGKEPSQMPNELSLLTQAGVLFGS